MTFGGTIVGTPCFETALALPHPEGAVDADEGTRRVILQGDGPSHSAAAAALGRKAGARIPGAGTDNAPPPRVARNEPPWCDGLNEGAGGVQEPAKRPAKESWRGWPATRRPWGAN
mmetsp:Transcript_15136/g.26836  ORF Transcript_15136/g.26836 Transcript_15136/m.26836 type:complete len:116 (-) Transcript_15136:1447-1794(-)